MKKYLVLLLTLTAIPLAAQTATITYQGRVKASGMLVNSVGQFAFAIVNQAGNHTFWSHDNSSSVGDQPISVIQLPITQGLFSVQLGDEGIPVHGHPQNLPGMQGIPVWVFTNAPIYLRIWFDDGQRGMQQLSPDLLLATAPFAVNAGGLAPGSITASAIQDGAVTFSKLANGSVGAAQIANGAVGTAQLGGGVVTAAKIANGAITGAKLANNSISSAQIMNGAVTEAKLAGNSVTAAKISNGAITQAKLADGIVGTDQLANGSVTAAKLAANSVRSTNLINGTVTSPAIQDDAVTTPKIANGAVTAAKMAANSVGSTQLADGSITSSKLATGAVLSFLTNNSANYVPPGGLIFSREPASANLINAGYRQVGSIHPRTGSVGFSKLPYNFDIRVGARAVWTGNRFAMFGGQHQGTYFDDGYRFRPGDPQATPLGSVNGPSARALHSATWAKDTMVVWGGRSSSTSNLGNGAAWSPTTDSWTNLPTSGAPSARFHHSATWTGTEIIIFGGYDGNLAVGGGARLQHDGSSWNSWSALDVSDTHTPSSRYGHCAVWIGSKLLIWGGVGNSGTNAVALADGAAYHPNAADKWTPISTSNAPSRRSFPARAWTGREMLVWGGFDDATGSAVPGGARYNPQTDTWTPMSAVNAPPAGKDIFGFWTGDYFIIMGHKDSQTPFTGGIYDPENDTWETLNSFGLFEANSDWNVIPAAWSGDELFIYNSKFSTTVHHLYRPPSKPLFLYQK